ncbi:DUF177 domain-containing protein [Microbacterium sp. LRZ72]|uniref:YceD family protein n=1 Tax=Microbacterium sp. LRZ72 TaxID=2942481 RepID=UPI0029AE6B3A|nr:DUF177 domain-containing protein [Microbacterium sp. LRZ72]MDX2375599.1 DUF177 domain-containing protein [Microbacterium sp. LRZ72]
MREAQIEATPAERWGEGLVAVQAGEPVRVAARLESVHEGILVTAEVDTRYTGVCGRCLTDIAAPVEVEFQELFAYPGEEESDFEVQDNHVDLETPVRDTIVLSLPFQPVCSEDCPGLDPETGERKDEGSGIQEDADTDPRWAALRDVSFGADAEPRE